MKKRGIIGLLLFLFAAGYGNAQEWQTDFEQAKTVATKDNKPIILVFQGSDWCAACIKLNKEIWRTTEFIDYAKGHFVMLKADFPRKKENVLSEKQQTQNNQLAERYNKSGYFPYVLVLDNKGTVLGATGYKKTSPKEYIKILESFYL